MRIHDLGETSGDILVFGGPYSNAQATAALIDRAKALGIAGVNGICTGDVIAYGAAPVRTVELVRDWGATVVAGNCERQIAAGAKGCGCGFEAGSSCDMLSRGWYPHALMHTDAETRAWCAACPDLAVFTNAGRRWAVLHGGVTDIARFLWPVSPAAAFSEEIAALQAIVGPIDGVVAGHSGLPFLRRIETVDWLNAGAIGLPAHDGRPLTRFARIGAAGVTFETLAYDHVTAAGDMRAAGLTQGYETTLLTGWWPSEEVLPESLRRVGA